MYRLMLVFRLDVDFQRCSRFALSVLAVLLVIVRFDLEKDVLPIVQSMQRNPHQHR